jgi:hypothetical protein
LARRHHSRRRHLGARDLFHLAGRARSVVDKHALTEPQRPDVLLAADILRMRAVDEGANREGSYGGMKKAVA